jgi:hypothetical protein
MKVANFRDLMAGYPSAEIRCLYTGNTVRRLAVEGNLLRIDACVAGVGTVTVGLDVPITYKPWACDRGNLLFPAGECSGLPQEAIALGADALLKICGEGDTITFPDGSAQDVLPA